MSDTPRILIVHDDRNVAAILAAQLASAGYTSTVASSFGSGKDLLGSALPALLIVGARLGAYNGLHLVIRGRLDDPLMAAILVSDRPDPVLEAEADKHGALFLSAPVDPAMLLAFVARALSKDEV